MPSWFPADLLLYLVAVALGGLGATLANWSLHRRTYSLECAVADLEGKLLVEVKRRAGHERQNQRHLEQDIMDAAKKAPAPQQDLPWWQKIQAPRSFNG